MTWLEEKVVHGHSQLVTKKDKSIRFCVDDKRLNDLTKTDNYTLLRIGDTLNYAICIMTYMENLPAKLTAKSLYQSS